MVSDPLDAMKPDSPTVHGESNILGLRKIRKGNVEEAFQKADIIVEKEYHTQTQEHAYIEPVAGVSYMDGDVVIKVSTQNTRFDAREVARNLDLPVNRVRIIQAPPAVDLAENSMSLFKTGWVWLPSIPVCRRGWSIPAKSQSFVLENAMPR